MLAMVFEEFFRYSILIGYSISDTIYSLIRALPLLSFEKNHKSALWSVRKIKVDEEGIRKSDEQRQRLQGTRVQLLNNFAGAPTVSWRIKLGAFDAFYRTLQNDGADCDFRNIGVYYELFGKVGMGELRAGEECPLVAVNGDKFFGIKDDFFGTLTVCSKGV